MIDIKPEWQQLHWKQQVTLAKSILEDLGVNATSSQAEMLAGTMEAHQARAIIATEAKRQAEEVRKPTIEAAPVKEGEPTLPVYLDYDVWVDNPDKGKPEQPDTLRLRADPDHVQHLPFELARMMIDASKARRGDPLPRAV